MSEVTAPRPGEGKAATSGGIGGLVVETTAVQLVASMAVLLVPALAPEIAASLGVPASLVGVQIGILYVPAMILSLLAGALIRRFGACRTSQISMILTAVGCVLAAIPHVGTVIAGSLAIGAGYGLPNPSASHLLMTRAPARHRSLIFSVKQTGVPLGGMAAGLLGPALSLTIGWQGVLLLAAGTALLLAAISQPFRAEWDADRLTGPATRRSPLDGVRAVLRSRVLIGLCAASLSFSAIQLCVMSFMVVLLVEEMGMSLVRAGSILAVTQAAGVIGRLLWGVVADRCRSGMAVLIGLAAAMAGGSAAVVLMTPDWPLLPVMSVFALLGLTASGWNGVFLAEVAGRSGTTPVATATGGAMFFTFMGVVIGPASLSAAHGAFGGYTDSFAVLVVLALFGAAMVGIGARRRA